MNYPREPGSDKIVHEDEWNQKIPYGYCPACGSIGIEELAIPGDEDGCFYCSDVTCKTIMGKRSPARTKWNRTKPQEYVEKELDGWSWNDEHFPGQILPVACLD
jgi:hypothetical protein